MTSLDSSFLRAVVLVCGFKPEAMVRVQAALLSLAVNGVDFTAADLPRDLTQTESGHPNIHLAGCACGALVSEGLLAAVGRRKSPDPKAKGRKLNVFRLAPGKLGTAKAWFAANGIEYGRVPRLPSEQLKLVV
jgi:hypothetical protein